jgi:hypothetical protein
MEDVPTRVWFDADRTMFFLVPEDVELPEGTLELRTLPSRQASFDPDEVETYRVSRQEAAQAIDTAVGVDQAGEAVAKLLAGGRQLLGLDPSEDAEREAARLFGMSPGELITDPAAGGVGLRAAMQRLGDTLGEWDDRPEARARLRERMSSLGEKGKKASERLEEELEVALPKVGAAFEKLASSLRGAASRMQPEQEAEPDSGDA